MGRIKQEIIDQILDRLDIVEVIGEFVPLKKTGGSFKACCPFHNEKTPSFVVSPEKQIYHCFGCGAGGNAIGFVMKYENLSFPEAVRVLAPKAGVEVPETSEQENVTDSIATKLHEMNQIAASFFQSNLRGQSGHGALQYLKDRGLNPETLTTFRIGYAPEGWENLRKYCEKKGISHDLLRQAGLTIPSEKGKSDYDRFRNRVIYPVFNERGKIIAFGGRVMDDSLPKYINSPETIIYNKSRTLYGLNFARRAIRENGFVIMVEGYMDVVMPAQFGVNNVVATSGTALTIQQVSMIKKYTDTVVMVYDSDQAGESASLRGLDILLENGMKVRVARLPKGEDPDSFSRKNGGEAFLKAAREAKELFDYKLDLLIEKLGASDVAGIASEMLPTIAKAENYVQRSDYLKRLGQRLGVHESALQHELKKVKDYSYRFTADKKKTDEKRDLYNSGELHLLGLAISSRSMFESIENDLGLDRFTDNNIKKALMALKQMMDEGGTVNVTPGKFLSRIEEDEGVKNAVIAAIRNSDIGGEPEKVLKDCIFRMREDEFQAKYALLQDKLRGAKDNGEMLLLMKKMKDLKEEIKKIHKEKVA
ncbi:MAG: DNA primase [Candidatus Omnitrophica bacterium]|nr:DNA primase [Candidatus Omnitrophota bacterium]MDD5487955.1 DNA primase [Candidatus Omnitrophota bacterium]